MNKLEFDAAMMDIYERARDELGYNATRYLQMLHDHRGIETRVRSLIRCNRLMVSHFSGSKAD